MHSQDNPSAQLDAGSEPVREHRRTIATESPFNPLSLIGSWALYHSDERIEQALIVAEPVPGFYLVEDYGLVTDLPLTQRILGLADFGSVDEDGGRWTFY